MRQIGLESEDCPSNWDTKIGGRIYACATTTETVSEFQERLDGMFEGHPSSYSVSSQKHVWFPGKLKTQFKSFVLESNIELNAGQP